MGGRTRLERREHRRAKPPLPPLEKGGRACGRACGDWLGANIEVCDPPCPPFVRGRGRADARTLSSCSYSCSYSYSYSYSYSHSYSYIVALILVLMLNWNGDLRADEGGAAAAAQGAVPQADRAIERALAYLKKSQRGDGAWDSGGFGPATSVTSLAVMAYLAAGHVPGEPGPYRESIEKGIRYVLAHQHDNGVLASNTANGVMYCHGISTLMLAEVAGMTPEKELGDKVRSALVRAVRVILAAQDVPKDAANAGGWRYAPDSNDSDISVTGWQLMALRAAKSAGCDVPSSSIDRAVAYLKKCAVRDGGGFGYQAARQPQ